MGSDVRGGFFRVANVDLRCGFWCRALGLWSILDPILREGLVVSADERRGGSDHGDHNQPLTSQLFLLVQFLKQKKTVALGENLPPAAT